MKTLMNRLIPTMLMIASGIMLMTCLNSCKQDHLTFNTTSDVNMYSYLQQDSRFSMFKQIVDKAGYASFLNTYGTYTLFAPDNDGVKAYLTASGKGSIDNIDASTAKDLVSISIIADTIGSQLFSDGKLRTPTTSGQYLITGAVHVGDVTNIVVNKQANLIQGNIRVGNGIIHVIDNMLIPAPYTLAESLEKDPRYTIFTAALKATGLYDTLNKKPADNDNPNRKYLTVIAESDSVLNAAGYADVDALKARYSKTGNPLNNPADSLWLFMAYHIWPELSYMSDISLLPTHNTLAPSEITTSQVVGTDILLNNDTFNGVLEPGQLLSRPQSDVSALNGVIHSVLGHYTIKIRFPSPVYFDVCAQPEIIKTPGLYRVPGGPSAFPFKTGTIAGILLEGQGKGIGDQITYNNDKNPPSNYYYNNDFMEVGGRFRIGSNGMHAATFTTPVIVKGKYKIWVDYMVSQAQVVPTYFDGGDGMVALPNTLNLGDKLSSTETDAQAETRGYKSYSDAPVTDDKNPYKNHVGRLLGIVTVKSTDRHSIRFESTAGSGDGKHFYLDVIEFRPVDMDQIHPRLGHNGDLVP